MEHRKKSDDKPLLNEKGMLSREGYSITPALYNRSMIKHHRLSIHESDCYYIANRQFGLYIAISDRTLTGYISVILADFERGTVKSRTFTQFLPMGGMRMPSHPHKGELSFSNEKCGMSIVSVGMKKFIKCDFIDFYDNKNLYINLIVDTEESVSFFSSQQQSKGSKRFLYNCFNPSMTAKGIVRCGGDEYSADFDRTYVFHTFYRGTQTRHNRNAYLYANHYLSNDKPFSICFSDSAYVTGSSMSNVVIYDGYINKLNRVRTMQKNRMSKRNFVFVEPAHSIKLVFTPNENRRGLPMKATSYDTTVLFGRIEGDMLLDDDTPISFDRLPAIMEIPIV
ncbi:MAG: DUF2804 family protein [Clostridia bacterium]|nr:DUF2804 family protein [Clostridia bacterium]